MIKVFICMPYGDSNSLEQREHNTKRAMAAFHMLAEAGFMPICPHLSHFAHEHTNRPRDWWLDHSMMLLEHCDCLLQIGDATSGMRSEIMMAHISKQPVFGLMSQIQDAYGVGLEL